MVVLEQEILKYLIKTYPFLGLIAYIVFNEVHKRFMKKKVETNNIPACGGDTAHCVFTITRNQMNVVRTELENIKNNMQLSYATALTNYTEKNPVATSRDIATALSLHETLIEYATAQTENLMRQSLYENHIPKPEESAFDRYVKGKFENIHRTMWARYAKKYTTDVFYIPLKEREKTWQEYKQQYLLATFEIFKVLNDIKKNGG